MAKTDISVREPVGMINQGELRLPEPQRRYVWPATRVRDLLDSLYRGYPSGTILVWETSEDVPSRDLAIEQHVSAFGGHKLLLDGQQRLTSLSAVLRGEPLQFKNRVRPVDIAFNLDHPDGPPTEVIEGQDDEPSADRSLDLFEEFAEECEKMWFSFYPGLLVRTLVVFATGQSRFRTVASISVPTMKESWEEEKEGIRFAINFLRTNAGIEDESLLSSPLLVIPI